MKLKTLVCLSLITLVTSFSLTAHAQTFTIIHSFTGGADGANPQAGVTIRAGNLYGTASSGGIGNGSVFEIMHLGSNWITVPISVLAAGGSYPAARIVFGPDGHPYSTTYVGGASDVGIVFDLIVPQTICKTASCYWRENVLYQFSGTPDGAFPLGDLVWNHDGNIYGTASGGGASGKGAVYELLPLGNNWTEKVVWNFTGPDGDGPQNGIVIDENGNLFGTTIQDGTNGFGTVFKLTPSGDVWTETNVYNFQNGGDGEFPIAGIILDASGNLYGATIGGGSGGGGTVFELSPSGDTWIFKLLYSLSGIPGRDCGPYASLSMDGAGNLYGTTRCGGVNNLGNVFKLTNTRNGWVYSSLHDFSGGIGGANPFSNVTIDTNGNLYGTASIGGSMGQGAVWMIKP